MDMTALMPSLESLVLERLSDGRFLARGGRPGWCRDVRPTVDWHSSVVIEDVFPFLSVFLPAAERAWESDPPVRADSELWTETDDGSGEVHLLASAVRVRDACALVIVRNDSLFRDRQNLLQRGRELRLVHGALMKELEEKDILVHAIVHDLVAPLHSILGVLSLLAERTQNEPEAGWLRLAITAAQRQQELIGEILDVFTAEVAALNDVNPEGVELLGALERVVSERQPLAQSRSVRIERDATSARAYVIGEEMRLFRMLTNLVDNALRYSPMGGVVRITVRDEEAAVAVYIDDEGPGVSPDLLPRLFEKLARGRDRVGGTGLGLFFCRMTVENWGGAIGYEKRENDGARFWLRLRSAPRPDRRCTEERRDHGEAAHAGR
jgi:signal transduction histidine kinase